MNTSQMREEIAQTLDRERAALTQVEALQQRLAALQENSTLLAESADLSQQRLTFLLEASTLLAESFDYMKGLRLLAQLFVPQVADWCAIDVLAQNGQLERVAVMHTDPAKIKLAYEVQRRFPPDPSSQRGVYKVLGTGQSEMYEDIPESMLLAITRDEEQLTLARQLGLRSALIVPLITHERVFGVISVVMAESERHYSKPDLVLVEDLARRAATLVENARLYQESQKLNLELERRVEERTVRLEAANKELEAFSYSVSHDLRAPLRAIDGFSRILSEEYESALTPEALRYLQLVRNNTQRMGRLIDDLLAFSRLSRQPLKKQLVHPTKLAQEVVYDLSDERKDRRIELAISELPSCRADPALLTQVFTNLIANALKFTSKQEIGRIEIGYELVDGNCVYFVKDNGVGFDMEYVDKLFGVFQRLHQSNEYPGTGVGLAIVQRIIQRHGGQVWAEGAIDQGATFYFTLGMHDD